MVSIILPRVLPQFLRKITPGIHPRTSPETLLKNCPVISLKNSRGIIPALPPGILPRVISRIP